jgi:GDP-D-mannose dehydratase
MTRALIAGRNLYNHESPRRGFEFVTRKLLVMQPGSS